MKKDSRHSLTWGSRFRLTGRILGLTGLMAAAVGLFVLRATDTPITFQRILDLLKAPGGAAASIGALMLGIGTAVVTLVVLFELLSGATGGGVRSATKLNAGFQLLLAVGVFGAVNYFSFFHFKRWDSTRDGRFTLSPAIVDQLRTLQGKTTIVVLQQQRAFGRLSEKQDNVDSAVERAAERKVVERVRDLVDQLRLLGPRFNVVVLDAGAIDNDKLVEKETAERPGLREAIAATPENSILFYDDDAVKVIAKADATKIAGWSDRLRTQTIAGDENHLRVYGENIPRMSFNEFQLLDKAASKSAEYRDGKNQGNLVLRPQGVEPFVRRIISVHERRPRVGLLVVHEWLTAALSEGSQETYTSSGLRESLESQGFDVTDVVLKRWRRGSPPAPAVYNRDETEYDRRESELVSVDAGLRSSREEMDSLRSLQNLFRTASLDELNRQFRARFRREVTEEIRTRQLAAFDAAQEQIQKRIDELIKEKSELSEKTAKLMSRERAFEDRRVTDIRAKFTRIADEFDLLIVPRQTLINVADEEYIPSNVHRLIDEQTRVIREFMVRGKPVLALIGPNAEPNGPASLEPTDDFEKMLAERGIELGRQAVVFDGESKGFAARQAGELLGGGPADIPSIDFSGPAVESGKDKPRHPITSAMMAVGDSIQRSLEIRVRHPRPVYVVRELAEKLPVRSELFFSNKNCWNEESPFPGVRNLGNGQVAILPPRFEATPFDDPKWGTRDEERRGPFPLAVAIEGPVPSHWLYPRMGESESAAVAAMPFDGGLTAALLTAANAPDKVTGVSPLTGRKIPNGRLAVFGSGGIFVGKTLNGAQEQLLVQTCNWLLNRDERLPRIDTHWEYPRRRADPRWDFVWQYGPLVGLPLLFLYVGMVVLIIRRVR